MGFASSLMLSWVAVLVLAIIGRVKTLGWDGSLDHGLALLETGGAAPDQADTLVLYVFSNTDPEYYANLLYFVEHGMPGCDNCEYVVVINRGPNDLELELPELPVTARYIEHSNQCYDWGSFGWALESESADVLKYKYFIFLNSSVRGPFMPAYLKGEVHFTLLMTSKLVGDVKLVGPTINCEGTAEFATGERRQNPHVQSYAVATDAYGMQLLVAAGHVFQCYDHFEDTIYYSELGSSAVILNAGYNLDCFMARYQGVDWRDERNWGCNAAENPFNYAIEDPVGLAPMELMFVKVKRNILDLGSRSARAAAAYSGWHGSHEGNDAVLKNPTSSKRLENRAPLILQMAAVGLDCFDCSYYRARNADLSFQTCWEAWTHFINFGQFDLRPSRFTCDRKLENKTVPYTPVDDGLGWHQVTRFGCIRTPAQGGAVSVDQQLEILLINGGS